MPGKVKARVLAARNLPVMDRSSDTTDAFAEVRLADTTFKTDVCRKTLHPTWNSDWFRFDVDDRELQDEPLQIRIMDYDTYSANDAIGKVYVDLNPLLLKADFLAKTGEEVGHPRQGSFMSGWLPIFDTMHGVRGEVNVQVKVELFSDLNKFRTSSCGVLFFCTSGVPEGYRAKHINGFIEELVINDDPEYQWIDKIRTPRASNEARQALFMKLSSAVQRKIGLMALELGGNAVVGYQQKFDLEGDTGIVVRGIGTAVTLVKQTEPFETHKELGPRESLEHSEGGIGLRHSLDPSVTSSNGRTDSPHASMEQELNRRSPDSETGCSPKGNVLSGFPAFADRAMLSAKFSNIAGRVGLGHDGLVDVLEYPFVTMKKFPPGYIQRFGGLVSCRSVKLLEGQLEDHHLRDGWWHELRLEIRSHARCLGCNLVVGYTEDTAIWDDVVVLCASGTAAVGNMSMMLDLDQVGIFGPPYIPTGKTKTTDTSPGNQTSSLPPSCSLVHIPYNDFTLPYACRVSRCSSCSHGHVPDFMITTVEPPPQLELTGRGCHIQAKVLRLKRDLKGEHNAKEISDALPFIEYEIHRQFINKMKVKGMNAAFGLKTHLSLSARTIVATSSATAVYISAMSPPTPPRLVMTSATAAHHRDDQQFLQRMQRRLDEKVAENVKYYGVGRRVPEAYQDDDSVGDTDNDGETLETDTMGTGNKDTCVLEIDDSEDADIVESLMDCFPPASIQVFSTEELVGIAPGHIVKCSQMFAQVWRGRIHPSSRDLSNACQRLMSAIYFKLRRLKPCIICHIDFKADLNEENELQLSVYGTAIALAHGGKTRKELAIELESLDGVEMAAPSPTMSHKSLFRSNSRPMTRSTRKNSFFSEFRDPNIVTLTPLTYIPGAKIEIYLGNLNFFLIRETSSLREVGGLSSFVQSFICEIYSIVRSHVSALNGNALVSYFMSEFVVMHNPHKNQAQCLIHVGGDAVQVSYLPLS